MGTLLKQIADVPWHMDKHPALQWPVQAACRHRGDPDKQCPLHGLPEQLLMSRWNPSSPKFSRREFQWAQTQRCPRPGWMGLPVMWSGAAFPAHGRAVQGCFQPKPFHDHLHPPPLNPSCLHENKTHLRGAWIHTKVNKKSGRQWDWFHLVHSILGTLTTAMNINKRPLRKEGRRKCVQIL